MSTVYTKKEVSKCIELGLNYEYDKDLLNLLYQFHIDIGATKDLPEERNTLKKYLVRLHETITLYNRLYPDDVAFTVIYGDWMLAVVYEEVKRYGNNISALAKCFNDWYKINADKYIKSTAPTNNYKSRNIKDFTNVEIARLYETVDMLNNGDSIGGLFNTGGAKSFFKRLKQEYETRFN